MCEYPVLLSILTCRLDTLGVANRLAKSPSKENYLAFTWLKRSIDSLINGTLMTSVSNTGEPLKAFKLLKDIYLGCYSRLSEDSSDVALTVTITDVNQITALNAAQLYNLALRAGLGIKQTEDTHGTSATTT